MTRLKQIGEGALVGAFFTFITLVPALFPELMR